MSRSTSSVAVVSGGGSGIGAAIARALADRGDRVALLGRRLEPLSQVAAQIDALPLSVDVRDGEAVASAVERIEEELGPPAVVVAAAGVARVGELHELSPEAVKECLDSNLLGTALLFRAFLPSMLARRRGTLVPILSVAARRGFPAWSVYCASKWGTLGLVEALREEITGSGVRILALTPGATETPLWNDVAGEWDRTRMIPATEVAKALLWALDSGDRVAVEEIRLQPPSGNL